ncbi:MAG: YgaP family membrane protein [Bdellovibrionota bacterium]
MDKNLHPIERVIRVFGGAAVASLAFWGPKSSWYLLGLILVATGMLDWCPIYAALGLSTSPKNELLR